MRGTSVPPPQLFLRPGERLVLAAPDPRVCRFCGQDSASTPFRHDAHAIPQLLGNRTLFTREECDECNRFFGSTIENDLGNWTKPMRAFSRIKGKKGVPTLKNEKEGWRIKSDGTGLRMTECESNPKFKVDIEKRQFSLQLKRDPYTPVAVLKALVRVGLILLPNDELANFAETLEWVRNRDHTQPFVSEFPVFQTFQPGPMPNDLIVAMLMRRQPPSVDVPYAFLVLAYGNEVYQVFLPSPRKDRTIHGQKLSLPAFPTPLGLDLERFGRPSTRLIDLCGRDTVTDDVHPISMGFESVEVHGSP
ncbi:MAG: HNH endonuclease [Gammaproteobacteria bacterium]|nr:HNH endonuclease [Gammaproteobacteria bacterium]